MDINCRPVTSQLKLCDDHSAAPPDALARVPYPPVQKYIEHLLDIFKKCVPIHHEDTEKVNMMESSHRQRNGVENKQVLDCESNLCEEL